MYKNSCRHYNQCRDGQLAKHAKRARPYAYNHRMFTHFHIEMTRLALEDKFSSRALEKIITANVYQDRVRGQIGHDEYHFDNNAFEKSYAYLEAQRALTISALMANDVFSAWSAFGRLTHTAQDFYAHSDYIPRWLARFDYSPRSEAERGELR